MNLPKGHLSPSQLNTLDRCELQFKIFVVEGAKAPPDCALIVKSATHKSILEGDLRQKISSGLNMGETDIIELHRAELEQAVPKMNEDPNRTDDPVKIIDTETAYFSQIVKATEPWRKETRPVSVEQDVEGVIGGVPVKGRIDLIRDETTHNRLQDLKRVGQSPKAGMAEKSRQLATYAKLTGITDVGLVSIVENKAPKVVPDPGQIVNVSRIEAQYQKAAARIEWLMQTDNWMPVDVSDSRKDWICSKAYCGAWRADSKDWLTGRPIACPYGERAQTRISISDGNLIDKLNQSVLTQEK